MEQVIADGDNPHVIPYGKRSRIVQGRAQESPKKIVYERKCDNGQNNPDYGGVKGVEGGKAVF